MSHFLGRVLSLFPLSVAGGPADEGSLCFFCRSHKPLVAIADSWAGQCLLRVVARTKSPQEAPFEWHGELGTWGHLHLQGLQAGPGEQGQGPGVPWAPKKEQETAICSMELHHHCSVWRIGCSPSEHELVWPGEAVCILKLSYIVNKRKWWCFTAEELFSYLN